MLTNSSEPDTKARALRDENTARAIAIMKEECYIKLTDID
jgi:hypothetical protein